jgi:hypothetical protein
MREVLSDLNRGEGREEGNLLIEAVSLLVQRQRETESWIAEQITQAEDRAAASERRYAELEVRLAGIEEHLARLLPDVEPLRDDAAVDERLERLREQVEGLRSSGEARTLRPSPVPAAVAEPALDRESRPTPEPRTLSMRPAPEARPRPPTTVGVASGQSVSFWSVLGQTPQDRFGLVLIGAGLVAVVYAVLTQLRF